jgi:hypothetical protein
MDFELSLVIERLEALLKSSPNRSDFTELMALKIELEETLAQYLQDKERETCGHCENPCGNDHCPVIKENKCQK